jgi:hypothetical protein
MGDALDLIWADVRTARATILPMLVVAAFALLVVLLLFNVAMLLFG